MHMPFFAASRRLTPPCGPSTTGMFTFDDDYRQTIMTFDDVHGWKFVDPHAIFVRDTALPRRWSAARVADALDAFDAEHTT